MLLPSRSKHLCEFQKSSQDNLNGDSTTDDNSPNTDQSKDTINCTNKDTDKESNNISKQTNGEVTTKDDNIKSTEKNTSSDENNGGIVETSQD